MFRLLILLFLALGIAGSSMSYFAIHSLIYVVYFFLYFIGFFYFFFEKKKAVYFIISGLVLEMIITAFSNSIINTLFGKYIVIVNSVIIIMVLIESKNLN